MRVKNAREPSKIGRSGCIEGVSFLHSLTLPYNPPEQLKIPRWQHRTGASPVARTNSRSKGLELLFYRKHLSLIAEGKIDTTPLITHRFALKDIEKAYDIFENKLDGVIKIAIINE